MNDDVTEENDDVTEENDDVTEENDHVALYSQCGKQCLWHILISDE
jgi:hypothetical protein